MYLAHLDKTTNREQTLTQHCANVAALCRKYGEEIQCPNLAELCGLLHDMGKAKEEFQTYLKSDDKSLRGKINHSAAGAKYIWEKYGGSKNCIQRYTAQIISLVTCSHHTSLIDCIDPHGIDIFSSRVELDSETISYDECRNNFAAECVSSNNIDSLFVKATEEVMKIRESILSQHPSDEKIFLGFITRYLLSCVIDSDRFDTYCFYSNQNTEDTNYNLDRVWNQLCKTLEEYISKNYTQDTEINKQRSYISQECKQFAQKPNGVYRLYVPTGGGKTIASLRYAVNHADQHNISRIIYAIPYTSIIDQNASILRTALQNDEIILEHHSNVIVDTDDENREEISNRYSLLTAQV